MTQPPPNHGQPSNQWQQPPHHQQGGYPQDPPPRDAGLDPSTAIRLHVQGSVLTSNMVPPTITFNGYRIPVSGFGTHTIPVPPGEHRIHAEAQWMRTYGQADLTASVAPGQIVDVYYASPLHQFTTGDIGFEPQTRKGKGCLFTLLGVFALFVIGLIVLAVLAS